MTRGLVRFDESGQTHFVTCSCYRRRRYFSEPDTRDLFLQCLEEMRKRFGCCIYGYVVMPEHVHLLVSEPPQAKLADAMHSLKLSFSKRLCGRRRAQVSAQKRGANLGHTSVELSVKSGVFWQARYHDRNVRDDDEFKVKLRYLHRNPVERGLVVSPVEWKWSSYRHYALRESGVVEIESAWTGNDRERKITGSAEKIFLHPG